MLSAEEWAFVAFHLHHDEAGQHRRERAERDDTLALHFMILHDPKRAVEFLNPASAAQEQADPEEAFWQSDPYFGLTAMAPPPPTPADVLEEFGMAERGERVEQSRAG